MPGEIFGLFADGLAEPAEDFRGVDVVVIDPALVAGVVGRIDADTLHLPGVARQQRLEGVEIVALHNQIARSGIAMGELLVRFEQAERHLLVVPHNGVLADPVQCGHGTPGVGVCTRTWRCRSMAERCKVAKQTATTGVCRAEGGITGVLPVDGEFESRTKSTATAFSRLP